jgi:hypothetical protein
MDTLTTVKSAYSITDGEDFLLWIEPGIAKTWDSVTEAQEAALSVCYHPRRMMGRPRPVTVIVEATRYGSVLSVRPA